MRGGVSATEHHRRRLAMFSPRAWRCFYVVDDEALDAFVFSTCVEVFPIRQTLTLTMKRFLHVRGGVSSVRGTVAGMFKFSPRAWRCFHAHHK